jgi:hypothetical protein
LKALMTVISRRKLSALGVTELPHSAAKAALSSLYRSHQFYQFHAGAEKALCHVYRLLLNDIPSEAALDFTVWQNNTFYVCTSGSFVISQMHI